MKNYLNMTDEEFEGNQAFFEENRPIKLSIWDLILTLIFLASFFGCIYFYLQNNTLNIELENKHKLLMDLDKLYKAKNNAK